MSMEDAMQSQIEGAQHTYAAMSEEIHRLRAVYEAARRVLRFNGIDRDKVNEAVDEMDSAIERVKSFDSGLED